MKPLIAIYLSLIVAATANCKKGSSNAQNHIVYLGNQAFGAYLNGQPWIADYRNTGINYGPLDITMWWSSVRRYSYMTITGLKNNEEISLYIPPPLQTGRILLNRATLPYPYALNPEAYGQYRVYTPSRQFITNVQATGYVDVILCDTIQRKIEGRFEFEAINQSTGERVKITNGYFKKG